MPWCCRNGKLIHCNATFCYFSTEDRIVGFLGWCKEIKESAERERAQCTYAKSIVWIEWKWKMIYWCTKLIHRLLISTSSRLQKKKRDSARYDFFFIIVNSIHPLYLQNSKIIIHSIRTFRSFFPENMDLLYSTVSFSVFVLEKSFYYIIRI